VRVIGESEYTEIYWRLKRLSELVGFLVESHSRRDAEAYFRELFRMFGRVDTVLGSAETLVDEYGDFVLELPGGGRVKYYACFSHLLAFELTLATKVPVLIDNMFRILSLNLYWVSGDGYLSAFEHRAKRGVPDVLLVRGDSEVAQLSSGRNGLEDSSGGYFVARLTDTGSVEDYDVEITWWIVPSVAEGMGFAREVLRAGFQEDLDSRAEVYRKAFGSVLAQLDDILRSDSYREAVENTLAVLEMM